MAGILERFRIMFSQCDCQHHTVRQNLKLTASYVSGIFKGLLLLPLILPAYVLGVTLMNIIAFPLWLDHGYATIYYTRLFGRNLKWPIGVLYPILLLLYFMISIVLSIPFALIFALVYPGYSTAEVKMQTAWRYAYFWAGWIDTLNITRTNLMQYWYTVSLGARDALRMVRRRAWNYQYEFHPWNMLLAFIMYPILSIGTGLGLILILTLKFPFILIRSYINHFRGTGLWFRGPVLTIAWILLVPLIPAIASLSLPIALFYSFYQGFFASKMIITERGKLGPAGLHLYAIILRGHRESTRYMLGQDVPFLNLPASNPVSPVWLVLGFIPSICSLLVVPIIMGVIVLVSVIPVYVAAWSKLIRGMSSSTGSKPHILPFLILGVPLVIPFVPVALFGVYLAAILDGFTAFLVAHSKRSFLPGFQYIFAVNYIWEYKINKFAFAMDRYQQVHWASVLPQSWAFYAQRYMDPAEWDGGSGIPMSIVGKPARYIPPGLRRPKYLEDGTVVDMTVAAYDVPGVGITQIDTEGGLSIPLPPGLRSTPYAHHNKADRYSVSILPFAYKIAIQEATNAAAVVLAATRSSTKIVIPIPASLSSLPKDDAEAIVTMAAGMTAHNAESTGAESPHAPIPSYLGLSGDTGSMTPNGAIDHSAQVAAIVEEAPEPCCLCFSGINDGYEDDDESSPHHKDTKASTSSSFSINEVNFTAESIKRKAEISAKKKAVALEKKGEEERKRIEAQQASSTTSTGQAKDATNTAASSTGITASSTSSTSTGTTTTAVESSQSATAPTETSSSTITKTDTIANNPAEGISTSPTVVDVAEPIESTTAVPSTTNENISETLQASQALQKAAETLAAASTAVAAAKSVRATILNPSSSTTNTSIPESTTTTAATVPVPTSTAPPTVPTTASTTTNTKPQHKDEQNHVIAINAADDSEDEDDDDDDDDEEVFVLQPIVNNSLPDVWVEIPGPDGEPYYVNYARNQSSWRVPPGWTGGAVKPADIQGLTKQ